jgi:hypothetical protein
VEGYSSPIAQVAHGAPDSRDLLELAVHCHQAAFSNSASASSSMLIAAPPLPAGLPGGVRVPVAEFDLAAAVQEDAEGDADGIGRDLGGDLVAGPVAGSADKGEVVPGIVPGIR